MQVLEEGGTRDYDEHGTDVKTHVLTFDYSGAITLAVWISSFLAVIDLQNQLSWGHPLVWSIATVGLLALVAFLALETYPGNRELLVPLHLLKTEVGVFCAGQVSLVLPPLKVNSLDPAPRDCSNNLATWENVFIDCEGFTSYLSLAVVTVYVKHSMSLSASLMNAS